MKKATVTKLKTSPMTKLRASPLKRVSPFKEIGGSGTAIFGGFVETIESDSRLSGTNKYKTISDMVTNTSIVAAGVRYFLNLMSRPSWTFEPADDSDEAKELAEWAEKAIHDCKTGWYRIVRKAGLYIFHGFGVQEWTAKRDDDGKIVFDDIESRPQHTISRWDVDDRGTVIGCWQQPAVAPLNSGNRMGEVYLPREKLLYLVDDTLTDSPEGLGIYRHLVAPATTMKRYRQLELMGYDRDLRGIPVGRAPFATLNSQVQNNQITEEQMELSLKGIRDFVKMQAKGKATGVVIDSETYEGMSDAGEQPSGTQKWGIELLSGTTGSIVELARSIGELTHDMARIMGIENVLVGSAGTGSLALSEDKSHNLYLNVTSTVSCIREAVDRDIIGALWAMNGLDNKLKPKAKTSEVGFNDVNNITNALRDMATAGAVLAPDDPAINEVRQLLGLSKSAPYDVIAAEADAQRNLKETKRPGTDDGTVEDAYAKRIMQQ